MCYKCRLRIVVAAVGQRREKDDLCLKKVYPVRRSECIPMKKQRLLRSPIAFAEKRDARKAKPMSIGFARSERFVEKLHPRTSSLRNRKFRQRVLGPRILRSKSKASARIRAKRHPCRGRIGTQPARAFRQPESERVLETRSFSRCLRGCSGIVQGWLCLDDIAIVEVFFRRRLAGRDFGVKPFLSL